MLLAWLTPSWASGKLRTSISFSAWETLLEDKSPLYFAVRRPESPLRHDEVMNHRGGNSGCRTAKNCVEQQNLK
ncbi:unnamed protein product [Strongylus vulgaris]|uniref:Uncharacterized protein n=1 Tax=Strongylus vulgaris TaxID=40348 RepID=A0A3P7IP02_STRVU|nr:unnamed protein product [Strongylus vulgaris]